MDNEENVAVDNSNTTEETVLETVEAETEETLEEVKARLAKAEELSQNYKVRAEKAERKAKDTQKVEVRNSDTLTQLDTISLIKNNVHEEDISEVARYAKFNNISVQDALKDDVMRTILKNKEEKRASAEATNTNSARRGAAKVSDEDLVAKSSKGELPSSDDDIARLAAARLRNKGNKRQ